MENEQYVPAPHVLDRLSMVDLLAVIGPTAAGKTSIIREAIRREPSLHLVVSSTSRDPRPDEQEGVDFRFETRAHMEELIAHGEYAQVAPSLFGDLYATAAEDYSTEGIALQPVLAEAMPVFRTLPFKRLRKVYILPPDWDTWQQRIQLHRFTGDKLAKRLVEAKSSLHATLEGTKRDFVINNTLAEATDDFITIALEQPYSERLKIDQERAPELVRNLLERLDRELFDPALV